MGYHINKIPKGKYGKVSKIKEEFYEFLDAHEQGNNVMELVELSDLLLAIHGYLKKKYKTITLQNILDMAAATKRAFKDGDR